MADDMPKRGVFQRDPTTDKVPLRYVIYSTQAGIYLGDDRWSRTNPGPRVSAPTFTENEVHDKIRELEADGSHVGLAHRIAWPDLGTDASVEACANAALPRWEPVLPKAE